MTDVALLIEFDVHGDGSRPGGLDVRKDRGQKGDGLWQDLKRVPALELREILDDRDMGQYEDVEGITIITGKAAINAAIDANFEPRYKVANEVMYKSSFDSKVSKDFQLADLDGDPEVALKQLKDDYDVKGISVAYPRKL